MVVLDCALRAQGLAEISARLLEVIRVRHKRCAVLPSNQLSTHDEWWSIRIDGSSLIEKSGRIFWVVQDHQTLTKDGHGENIP